MMSGRVDASCPSFTNEGPRSSSTRRARTASVISVRARAPRASSSASLASVGFFRAKPRRWASSPKPWRTSTVEISRTRPMSRAAWRMETMVSRNWARGSTDPNQRAPFVLRGKHRRPTGGDAWARPIEHALCIEWTQVDAAVAADSSEVMVPKRTVQAVAFFEVHDPGHTLDGVIATGFLVFQVVHVARAQFDPNPVFTRGGRGFGVSDASSRRNQGAEH